MHATPAVQTPPPKTLTGSSPKAGESSQNAGAASTPTKTKKRERNDSTNEASKRERSLNPEEGETAATSSVKSNDQGGGTTTTMEEFEKDGLTSVGSVEKLVSTMHQDRNDGSRKASEFASRRTALASAISSTESNECLERFVQLGGVALFHEWLQEAYKGKCGDGESPKDGGSKGMDELLLTILSALEKLPVDLQALRCQVGKSVNNLKSHKNVEIKEKARKLVETWKKRVGDEMNGASQWSTNMKNLPGTDMAGVQASNGAPLPLLKPSEKGSTNLSPNNGQLWTSNSAGALTWKEDVKSPSSGGSKGPHRNTQVKGLNLATNKDSTTSKPLVWSRNAAEKGDAATLESGTKRLPRSGSAGVNEEMFGPPSQGSSPGLPDQTAPSSIADAPPDTKQKLPASATKYPLPPELSADQQQDDNGATKAEAEKKIPAADAVIMSEASRISDSNDRAVSMAIVPVSAVSRISGSERNAGASGRSTVLSEAGTIDQEAAAHGSADTGAPSQCKDEVRRKETQDGGDGANCASSSSFTEMSVAGQGAVAEQKSELSSATMDGEEALRPVEGLGESPEPRPSSRRAAADGDTLQDKKLSADVSSTQGSKAPFGRTSFDGLGRRLERYDNSWDEKRTSFFFGKDGRKLSSEADSRKHGAELENVRPKPAEYKEIKRADSASEFAEDDALEVAQQIAKEVEQEVETSHLSSTKDDRDHLLTREADASPGHLMEKCPAPLQRTDSGPKVGDVQPVDADREKKEETQEPVESASTPTDDQAEPDTSARVEDDKPRAENVVSRPVFDLNEGVGGDEGLKEVPCTPVQNVVASVAVPTTPIPVLPTTKGAFIPPEPPVKTKLEPGWRGSAATSAFRPAEPRRVQESQQQNTVENRESSTVKQTRPPLDIDLNVADTETVFESQSPFVKPRQTSSTLGRVDFDLNCADETEDGMVLEMKVESIGLGRKDAQGTTTRNFDLNGPVEEEPTVQQVSLRNSSETTTMVGPSVGFRVGGGGPGGSTGGELGGVAPWFPSGNSFSAVAIPAFPMARAETSYPVQAQPYLNAGPGSLHFDLYRGGMTLATPAVAYPANPPVPYPYAAGFPFASNYTFNNSAGSFPAPFVEAPAGSASYAAPVSSQIGGGPGAMSRYIRPHLMGIPETGGRVDSAGGTWGPRPSLDLNTGPDAADELRPQQNGGRTVALEDHLRGFGQVAQAGKRKEPESGWEVLQAGYKQPAWC